MGIFVSLSTNSFAQQNIEDFPQSQNFDKKHCTQTNPDGKHLGNFFCKNIPDFKNMSPIKQVKLGLSPSDVICKKIHTLVIKESNLAPACIKPDHLERFLSNGWYFIPPSERAIRPMVTVLENEDDLGIKLTKMKVTSQQNYHKILENYLNVTSLQGILDGSPIVVGKITNVNDKNIVLNQVVDFGSALPDNSTVITIMYADAIGCSIEQWRDGFVFCPYHTASYDPIVLTSGESFVFYFLDDFKHNNGTISKITTAIWYELEGDDNQEKRTEIEYLLEFENEN